MGSIRSDCPNCFGIGGILAPPSSVVEELVGQRIYGLALGSDDRCQRS